MGATRRRLGGAPAGSGIGLVHRYPRRVPGAVTITDLCVAYDGRRALDGVSLDLPAGSTLAVIGPNGSGKSTLLKAIAGIEQPERGRIDRHGHDVAFVLQSTDIDRAVPITVRATVALARYPSVGLVRPFRRVDRDAVARALDRLEIADLAGRQLHDLSGGQRQRVLVAQGLAQAAPVLLLDEPVTGLDLVSRQVIFDVMAEERGRGTAVVMTTHNLEDARRCDQVLLLSTRPIAVGPPDDVLRDEPLREAFGGRFARVGNELVLDDPHHHHDHHHP